VHANPIGTAFYSDKIIEAAQQTSTPNIMSFLPQRCARQLLREPFQRRSLPLFLTPAFSPSPAQCFSTTSPMKSRVGGAPISVPPEVTLSLVDLPKTLVRARGKDVPKLAAHIKGPKGSFRIAPTSDELEANTDG